MPYRIGERRDPTGRTRGYYVNLPSDTGRRQLSFPTKGEAQDWARLADARGLPHAVAAYNALTRRGPRRTEGALAAGGVMLLDLADAYLASRTNSGGRAAYRSRLATVAAYEPFQVTPAARLSRDDLEAFATWLATTYRSPSTGRLLAHSSVHQTYAFVAQVLRRAVRRGDLAVDPTLGVENKPKALSAEDTQEDQDAVVISQREFDAIRARLRAPASDLVFRTLWATGMRYGEVTALGPHHVVVEHERAYLTVRRTWTRGDNRTYVLGAETKGKRVRRVSIPLALAKELQEVEPTTVEPDMAPHARKDRDRLLLFPNKFGYRPDWTRARDEAAALGLAPEGVKPHSLRHSHVTHLLRARIPVHVVTARVGHATTAYTMDHYGHVIPEDEDAVVGLVEQGLG